MNAFSLLPAVLGLALTPAAFGQAQAELNVFYETDPGGLKFTAQLHGPDGVPFAFLLDIDGTGPRVVGISPAGADYVTVVPAQAVYAVGTSVHFSAAYRSGGVWNFTEPADLILGDRPECDLLDFNYAPGPDEGQVAGQLITSQWTDMGMQVSARNNYSGAGHPDKAILFDSGNPTGGDDDLETPNLGAVGNDTALGMILILAENDLDLFPADGLVDVPDDEAGGGSLVFDFENGATVCSVTLVDIDETPGTQLRFYRNGDLVTPDETLDILSLGDGSVQRVDFLEADVERFEVYLEGSGGIGRMELIPCPRVINFDETSTGIPRDLSVGEWITNQFENIGVTISAFNNDPTHPDKVILFDSENPTGEDPDLMTPNPAVDGNDTPLGKVLILAEDDVDVDPADGFVDDPDDEAAGGLICFAFAADVTILSATVLDVDGNELDLLRFYDAADDEITSIVIPDRPDGNVQRIETDVSGVRKLVFELGGSGAITRVRFCPDPEPTTPQ